MLERLFSSLFFCVVVFHSVLVQCCSVLFCLGCWRAPFSLLSEPFSSFFPSCLSLVTSFFFFFSFFHFFLFFFFSTFVRLLCDRVFLFFSFIFCGHFSLISSSRLHVLFCLGCCRAPFCLLSATFCTVFPKLFVLSNGVDFVVVLFSFLWLFFTQFLFSVVCSVLFRVL